MIEVARILELPKPFPNFLNDLVGKRREQKNDLLGNGF